MGEFHRCGLIAPSRDLPTEEHAGAPGGITGHVHHATPERHHRRRVPASRSSAAPEATDERRLLNFQKRLSRLKLLIIDELGFVPLSRTGAELLFEVFSQRYERGAVIVTTNLPFDEWTEVFGSERLTGALLDRLTHHVHILEMNGESYRLRQSRQTSVMPTSD